MKHNNLYVLTLTSAAMLGGAVAAAQERTDRAAQARSSGMHATKLIGAIVRNNAGDSIGAIDDLIVTAGANVTTAVVSVGGALGIGDKKIGIPFKSFSVSPDGNTVYLDMTEQQLKSLPAYTDASNDRSAATSCTQAELNPLATAPSSGPAR